ncbi:MAG: hypothetical protein JXA93_23085 [Anaerolineae bacterium]|nr:hypothetical protein [Anaerolineae bacterium]
MAPLLFIQFAGLQKADNKAVLLIIENRFSNTPMPGLHSYQQPLQALTTTRPSPADPWRKRGQACSH